MTDQLIDELLVAVEGMRVGGKAINFSIYHFDLFMVTGKPHHLKLAVAGMKKYRALGGEDYQNAERCMKAALRTMEGK